VSLPVSSRRSHVWMQRLTRETAEGLQVWEFEREGFYRGGENVLDLIKVRGDHGRRRPMRCYFRALQSTDLAAAAAHAQLSTAQSQRRQEEGRRQVL
jgi:hypothetical protein